MINSLKIFNGEHIKRSVFWYIFVFSITIFLVIFSFFKGGIMGGISILFVFAITIIGYIILYLISLKKTKVELYEGYIILSGKTYSFDTLYGFNADINNKGEIENFIIVLSSGEYGEPSKYTLNDSQENAQKFFSDLVNSGLGIYNTYENDKLYKIKKLLKL